MLAVIFLLCYPEAALNAARKEAESGISCLPSMPRHAAKGSIRLAAMLCVNNRHRHCCMRSRPGLRRRNRSPCRPVRWPKLAVIRLRSGRNSAVSSNIPELELSNNLAENSMRPVALGRKNWIHIGSAQAGAKVAAILSVVESCRRMKLSARDYLRAVLPGLAARSIQRVAELTPAAWAAQHP